MAMGVVLIRTQKRKRVGDLQVHGLLGPELIGAKLVIWGGFPSGIEAELHIPQLRGIDEVIKGLVEIRNKLAEDRMEITHVREDKDGPPAGRT